ncbi:MULTISPECIES: oligosaccharide flippase family protein [unclassified Acinetobacter]|uniref:oligosaccharide flippase family protein n=11 Tax=Acinetobacter TaxID=469 RepID=UPI001D0DFE89|nr:MULTISPECIES: oligosaccharide flippase family protein [unclassified Acinetobacter]
MNFFKVSNFIKEYKTVIENYFFMTVLQFVNSFAYLAIYPYLILKLGVDQYGIYVFALSIVTILINIINFGFDLPALKVVSENPQDKNKKKEILDVVTSSKIYLTIISTIFFFFLLVSIPLLYNHIEILLLTYLQVLGTIFLPLWYFQGIQKMKLVTILQVIFKILSIPLIILLVKEKNDFINFVLIASLTTVTSSILAFVLILYTEKINFKLKRISEIKHIFKESFPFFLNSITSVIKDQSVVIVMGIFFGMKEVALYDLAMKIIIIPRTIFVSLNAAIFPKIINKITKQRIKNIIKFEFAIGFFVIFFITVLGWYLVDLLGHGKMGEAYILSVILSVTVLTWLVVGCFVNFIFVPNNKTFYVAKNQFVALVVLCGVMLIGLFLIKNIVVLALAVAISALAEIIYCYFVVKKEKLI